MSGRSGVEVEASSALVGESAFATDSPAERGMELPGRAIADSRGS